jgi:hypothetical protein
MFSSFLLATGNHVFLDTLTNVIHGQMQDAIPATRGVVALIIGLAVAFKVAHGSERALILVLEGIGLIIAFQLGISGAQAMFPIT